MDTIDRLIHYFNVTDNIYKIAYAHDLVILRTEKHENVLFVRM